MIYRDELMRLAAFDELEIRLTLTRDRPADWLGYHGRIDAAMLKDFAWPAEAEPLIYISGAPAFVDAVRAALVANGHDAGLIVATSDLPGRAGGAG